MKRVTPDAKAGTGGLRHEAIDHEVLIGPRVVRPLFRRSATVSLGVAAIVIAAGVAGLALGVGRAPTRRSHHAAVRPRLPTCRPAGASAPSAAPTELGAWPYDLTMPGTFEMITAAQGSLFALEACGAEESSLRVVEIDERSGSAIASAAFGRAAPIASSIAVTTEGLFFGESRLVLGGTAGTPPYRLSIVELRPPGPEGREDHPRRARLRADAPRRPGRLTPRFHRAAAAGGGRERHRPYGRVLPGSRGPARGSRPGLGSRARESLHPECDGTCGLDPARTRRPPVGLACLGPLASRRRGGGVPRRRPGRRTSGGE